MALLEPRLEHAMIRSTWAISYVVGEDRMFLLVCLWKYISKCSSMYLPIHRITVLASVLHAARPASRNSTAKPRVLHFCETRIAFECPHWEAAEPIRDCFYGLYTHLMSSLLQYNVAVGYWQVVCERAVDISD